MDKQDLDEKIAKVVKAILSYCATRTPNQFEAEDLAQEIIVEIYKSAANIRNDEAFYGFMWSVAGNVYKQWYKKKLKNRESELTEDLRDNSNILEDKDTDISLLRREAICMSAGICCRAGENRCCQRLTWC